MNEHAQMGSFAVHWAAQTYYLQHTRCCAKQERKIPSLKHTIMHFSLGVYSVFKFITLAIFISLAVKFASGLKDDGVDGHTSTTTSVLKCASHRHSWFFEDFDGFQYKQL